MKKFLLSWVINTLAVAVAVAVLHGHINYARPLYLLIASLILGLLNAFVRPILLLMALPLVIFTLGLFTVVINAFLLYMVAWLMGPAFTVDSFGWALLGALIISIVSMTLNVLTGTGGTRVKFHRVRRPPDNGDQGGNGPVIDI